MKRKVGALEKIEADHAALRFKIKRDPQSYRDDFSNQWQQYETLRDLFLQNPSTQGTGLSDLKDLVEFVSHVADLYPDLTGGFANDLQRFRCCACGRTFNDLSGTPLARLRHKAKWIAYSQVLLHSLSVRKGAERVGVHRNTAFWWRHRFLAWVKLDRPASLNGIVEADETFLLESQKGSRTLDRPPRRHRRAHRLRVRRPRGRRGIR